MYGLTRGTITLLGAAVAGLLVWLATQVNDSSNGGYWASFITDIPIVTYYLEE
jgi:hypothetical protein